MSEKPELPLGYLGAQPKFSDLGLSALSHIEPEIRTNDNQMEIKLKCKDNLKVTHQLINCRTDEEKSEYVFTQTLHGTISFIISLPESGYYKFQIFALPAQDDSKTLPNVYNYLINCVRALQPAFKFPKQYAQWKDGCYLHEPLVLHKDAPLRNVFFKVIIPGANAVAVVADGEWFHLEKKGNHFEGKANLEPFKGKDTKITLNANCGSDESKYSTMLEYRL
ncbi:uncharacterized protein LOC127871145 [Dreissena polymorpha]|uniref:KY-like immunoglobulin-like domain-containing protein n=1 Tax=Dreissena polymorpha TaxID=45954 RepID=A0A9D4LCH7_DREPO|nr:uncharacterized protein LOC127871145 [Dreissena polymorpha]KAH3856025.1 hypothetical protein DPMN_098605 [Dreissena polymorpha]